MEKDYDKIFLCVPIDKYYNYKFGILPYRSILFENRKEKGDDLQSPVLNFTDDEKYTRKTQWSLFPNSYQNLIILKRLHMKYLVPWKKILMNTIIQYKQKNQIFFLKNIRNYLYRIVN